ncbi:MAG: hypothetical protein E7219_00850 [Clostridiales bacterium]|nr:hypothetical protein [Clostridiales bacterium]
MKNEHLHLRILAVLTLAVTMLASSLCMGRSPLTYHVSAEDVPSIDAGMDINDISKFGNIKLVKDGRLLTKADLSAAGISYGDIVTVSFLDQEITMPVAGDYSEVGKGDALLREDDNEAELAINMGAFASEYIADKSSFEDGTFAWTYKKGVSDVTFHIELKQKGGLFTEYGESDLVYSDKREDFPDLSDEQFANFRVISTTGMGKDVLYRTASPVNPRRGRNTYADAACKEHGIKAFVNLADSKDELAGFPGFDETYYSTADYIPLSMGLDFEDKDFRDKLARGLRFIIEHDGPYAIHCTEGKDRAGVVAALLECFMGASYDEIAADYMVTFYNYYGITPDDERYDKIVEENIDATLGALYGTDDIKSADLAAEAEDYFKECGLTDDEIDSLRGRLGGEKSEAGNYRAFLGFAAAIALCIVIAAVYRKKKQSKNSDKEEA